MTNYIPTAIQREAYGADHSSRETKGSIVRLVIGKNIDRVKVLAYVAHEIDATGENDTIGIYSLEIRAGGRNIDGYATIAFNLVEGVPIAAELRDFQVTVSI